MSFRIGLLVLLTAVVGVAVGVVLAGGSDALTVTETVTRTETAASLLPASVERTRAAVRAAAASRRWDAVERLVPRRAFNYSFGGAFEGGAIAYWRDVQATTGEDPLAALVRVLSLPPALSAGVYVFPFAYNLAPNELTAYERRLLGALADDYGGDAYLGWRAGIRPDGHWSFFVRGD
jgi:hypothetical protein